MSNPETLMQLCYDDKGAVKPKPECRAAMINHLILDEMMDIDEAEDLAEETLNKANLWVAPPTEPTEPDTESPE